MKLGQAMEADLILEQALTKYGPADWLDPTFIKFDRAQCKLLEGDIDEALAIARATLDGLGETAGPASSCSAPMRWPGRWRPRPPAIAGLKLFQESLRARRRRIR